MIDIHTHIMPGIDDGARDINETLNLIKEAGKCGFNEIVLTPHYIEGYYEADVKTRKELMEEIDRKIADKDIKLYMANEVYLTENIIKLLNDNKISSINNTKYILFEMPMNIKPMIIYEVAFEILQHNFIPILAHPERYEYIKKDPKLIYELIQNGVLMQANYGSIIGMYGRKSQIMVKKFLQNNMIHFLGTDVHKQDSIYNKIPQILNKLEKWIGKDNVNKLVEVNPRKVLNNEKIKVNEPTKIKYTLLEKLIMEQ